MKNYLIILLSITLLNCDKEALSFDEEKKTKILGYLKKEMAKEGIPGLQISILKQNKIILSENLGVANVPFSAEVKDSTIFSINSIAKVFASTAILQLEEQNKLFLSDSIAKHIPNLPNNWKAITIRQLLSHTSGLPDIEDPYKDELVGGKDQDTAWEIVQKMPLQSSPGDAFSYNATNYLLVQKIVEKCSGVSFEEFVRKNQFDMANMKEINYGNSFDIRKNKGPTYCYYYQDEKTGEYEKGTNLIEVYENFPTSLRADAGVFCSANEMSKWIIALQSGKFLQKENITKMWKPVKLNNGNYTGFDEFLNAYALGWPVIKRGSHSGVSPFGGGRASFSIYPEDNLAIVLFTNLSGVYTYKMIDDIAKYYYN